jgi:hypothetical protein
MKYSKLVAVIFLVLCIMLSSCGKKGEAAKGATKAEQLFSLKNPYIGNASANGAILEALAISNLGKYKFALETDTNPYTLTINFSEISVTEEVLNSKMEQYALILLALIENADEIHWNVDTDDVQQSGGISMEIADKQYSNIKQAAASVKSLQAFLDAVGY